jgi:hypothetical protein
LRSWNLLNGHVQHLLCDRKGMTTVAVKEFSWEEISSSDFENPARKAWREAVTEIAEKAKAKLPECSGRVESASPKPQASVPGVGARFVTAAKT